MKALKQTESVIAYTTQFLNLSGQITNLSDLDKAEHYIDRLKPATQCQLKITYPQTLNNVITQATNFDTTTFRYSNPSNNRQKGSNRLNNTMKHLRHNNARGDEPMDLDAMSSKCKLNY